MNKMDLMQDKKTAAKAVHKHEKAKHPGQPLTKMRAGGKTNSDMLKMGRNMAKIANQKSPGRKGA
jgi:hypothetical protein